MQHFTQPGSHDAAYNDPVLLFSGGLDSFITAYATPSAKLLYIDTQAAYAEKEKAQLIALSVLLQRPVTVDTRLNLRDWERADAIVPARNAFLALMASHYGRDILLAATSGDLSTDKDNKFAGYMTQLMSHVYSGKHFPDYPPTQLWLPFKDYSKAQMVEWYLGTGGDKDTLSRLVSCYDPAILHCGQCKACIRKWVALAYHDCDFTEWDVHPRQYNWGPVIQQIKAKGLGAWRGLQEDRDTLTVLKAYGWSI